VHGAVINAEPKTSANNSLPLSFCKRHKNKLFTLATVIILAAIVIPSAVVGVRNSYVSTHSTVNTSSNDNSTDEFDDSKQLNAETPPLNQLFQYGGSPIRGVNLGGWLVLEPFITPSIFEQFDPAEGVIDEWTLCEKLGLDEAKKQLQDHYDTFITEDDFKKISTMGINHVRIPTGHWAVNPIEGEPFVPNLAWEYLLKGIQWARKYGIRVMVELHTAPGSQNGWNHSGRVGSIGWLNGSYGELNANHTINTVLPMVEYFSRPEWSNVVTIFGVLNEPAIYRLNRERASDWYLESYYAIRNVTGEGKGPILTYHEGFIGLSKWKGFMPNTTFDRTILGKTILHVDCPTISLNSFLAYANIRNPYIPYFRPRLGVHEPKFTVRISLQGLEKRLANVPSGLWSNHGWRIFRGD
jgi:glucan 1,3-beta-glucosidase